MSSLASIAFLRPTIAHLLRAEPEKLGWSVQGFGMIRAYVGPPNNPKEYRLNIWSSDLAVPGVSTIHDHPWEFDSIIVAGAFVNQRYYLTKLSYRDEWPFEQPPTHTFTTIKCGLGGGMEKEPLRSCVLRPKRPELYSPGDTYGQEHSEIHETIYADGCVTLNKRVGDSEHARVFWPAGTEWVDAMPRDASVGEIKRTIDKALEWF